MLRRAVTGTGWRGACSWRGTCCRGWHATKNRRAIVDARVAQARLRCGPRFTHAAACRDRYGLARSPFLEGHLPPGLARYAQ